MNNVCEFIDVNKTFNGREIYPANLSFAINRGEKYSITGKSGSGKSTILNMIMGFLSPDKGKLLLLGENISKESVFNFRKHCSWIPQSFNFLNGITVENAILFPFSFLNNQNIKPQKNKVIELLDLVKLKPDILNNDINELSGGERQRICSVISLLLERDIIILDEPTSNLDAEVSDDVMNIFFRSDKTIIISTHDKNIYDKSDNLLELS